MIVFYFIASGLLLYVTEPPTGWSPVAFIALIPLVHASQKSPSYRRAALGGWLAGGVFFFPALFWLSSVTVGNPVFELGPISIEAGTVGWIALSLYCAAYLAVFGVLARATSGVLPLAAGWVLLEYFRGAIAFTGFPWLLLSHSQYNFIQFAQILDVIGSYGLSGLLVALNLLLYRSLMSRQRQPLIVAGAIFAAVFVYGYVRMNTLSIEQSFRAAMVQASIPQEMKEALQETYDFEGVFVRYMAASASIPRDRKVDLIVWPETVVLSPYTLNVDPGVLRDAEDARFPQESLGGLAQFHDAYLLAGATSFLPAEHGYVSDIQIASKIPEGNWSKQYNSAYLLDPSGRYVDRYDKMHLVPFGEYIPLRNTLPFLSVFVPFDASLNAGERQTIFEMKTESEETFRFGVLICYEDTDTELARRLRRNGADFFVNISNDAWFGLSELDQHFVTARFRAIENRVGMVRSGNNGISGVIDPLGRAEVLLDKNEKGSATGDVWTSDSYPVYSRFGDWSAVLFSVAGLSAALARRRREQNGR